MNLFTIIIKLEVQIRPRIPHSNLNRLEFAGLLIDILYSGGD
jgi:hypothetical protein